MQARKAGEQEGLGGSRKWGHRVLCDKVPSARHGCAGNNSLDSRQSFAVKNSPHYTPTQHQLAVSKS